MSGYFCPLQVLLTTINSIYCLIIFIFNKEFYSKTSKNSRLYYILLALADIIAIYTVPFAYFFGDGINTLTDGNFYMYGSLHVKRIGMIVLLVALN